MEEQNMKELFLQASLDKKALEKESSKKDEILKKYLSIIEDVNQAARSAILAGNILSNIQALREILHLTNDIVLEKKND